MNRQEQIEQVDSWLKDLSTSLGVELKLDEEGTCALQIGEDIIIGLEVGYDFPMVYMYSPLMKLSSEDKDLAMSMMTRALELNAFQTATRGGAIGIAPGGGLLIFCYSTPIEGLDSAMFSGTLSGFYEAIPELRSLLSQTDANNLPEKIRKPQSKLWLKL